MMKLYSFHPGQTGPSSFFVVAENEQQARLAVSKHVESILAEGEKWRLDAEKRNPGCSFGNKYSYELSAWTTNQDQYEMTVSEPREVLSHGNE